MGILGITAIVFTVVSLGLGILLGYKLYTERKQRYFIMILKLSLRIVATVADIESTRVSMRNKYHSMKSIRVGCQIPALHLLKTILFKCYVW